MFNSQMLDAAIGLVFVYFFLSLLCSVIIEILTGLTKKRPRMLKAGIISLLQDPKALDKLYEQPLFIGKSPHPKSLINLLDSLNPMPSKKKRTPSYISSRSFVLSLLESLKKHPDIIKKFLHDKIPPPADKRQIKEFAKRLNGLPDDSSIKKALLPLLQSAGADQDAAFTKISAWYGKTVQEPATLKGILKELDIPATIGEFDNIRKLVDSLPDDNFIKNALLPLLDTADKSLDKAIDHMEKWYDEAMDRVTGWYKRYSQGLALLLAFVIALALNADTFEIGKAIYRDQAVRDSLVAMAQKQISADMKSASQGEHKEGAPASAADSAKPSTKESAASATQDSDLEKRVEQVQKDFMQISSINLPLGWPLTKDGWPDLSKIFGYHKDKAGKVRRAPPAVLTPGKLLGILLTALMVSLGSNFWFDLLNKLFNLRNAGKKPMTKDEREASKK